MENNSIDSGQKFDWGRTSQDYANHRPGPPKSFYDRLQSLGVCSQVGSKLLDLGTGTGLVAREFSSRGISCAGIDITKNQITAAKSFASINPIDFRVAGAEEIPFSDNSFNAVIANQCWIYFDLSKTLAEIHRVLNDNGLLVVSGFNFMPREDDLVRASENLVLKFNSKWTGADWQGNIPPMPKWADNAGLTLAAMFFYDELIPFTKDSWKGRMRACRGVSAALDSAQVQKFDTEHDDLISEMRGDSFYVVHRIHAHIFKFSSACRFPTTSQFACDTDPWM